MILSSVHCDLSPISQCAVTRMTLCAMLSQLDCETQIQLLTQLWCIFSFISHACIPRSKRSRVVLQAAELFRAVLLASAPEAATRLLALLQRSLPGTLSGPIHPPFASRMAHVPPMKQDLLEGLVSRLPVAMLVALGDANKQMLAPLVDTLLALPIALQLHGSYRAGAISLCFFRALLDGHGGSAAARQLLAKATGDKQLGVCILKCLNALCQHIDSLWSATAPPGLSIASPVGQLVSKHLRGIAFLAELLAHHQLPPPVQAVLAACLQTCSDCYDRSRRQLGGEGAALDMLQANLLAVFALVPLLCSADGAREMAEKAIGAVRLVVAGTLTARSEEAGLLPSLGCCLRAVLQHRSPAAAGAQAFEQMLHTVLSAQAASCSDGEASTGAGMEAKIEAVQHLARLCAWYELRDREAVEESKR
jgi:hypothetical protein